MENTTNDISYLTSEECLELTDNLSCNIAEDPLFILSLVVNAGLLILTSSSELMATSKCPFNSIWELVTYPITKKKRNREKELELEEQMEKAIEKAIEAVDV
jgi:hypothetical protein